jgi:hypothetical protein
MSERTTPCPPGVRAALLVLLNHVEPGWDNCKSVVQMWLDGKLDDEQPDVLPDCMMPDGAAPCKGVEQDRAGLLDDVRKGDEMLMAWFKASPSEEMVNRFLSWPLPKDFGPDCGITFTPLNHPNCWPIGTNLFTADQARQMLEHVLGEAVAQEFKYKFLDRAALEAYVDSHMDMVPRSRYNACNDDWLREKANAKKAMDSLGEMDAQLMRWFKAASPWATPGSLEEGIKDLERELEDVRRELRVRCGG